MKKLLLILPIALGACSTEQFYPYVGDRQVVVGAGGFMESHQNQQGVAFFKYGLPDKQECTLLGHYERNEMSRINRIHEIMAESIREVGGNTATQSTLTRTSRLGETDVLSDTGARSHTPQRLGHNPGFRSYLVFDCRK